MAYLRVASQDKTWKKLENLYTLGKSKEQLDSMDITFRNKEFDDDVEELNENMSVNSLSFRPHVQSISDPYSM